jgi:hypothetical protein
VPAEQDAYAALALADVRFALDVYRTAEGRYPQRLDELVDAGWITTAQTRIDGRPMIYASGGTGYTLEINTRTR